MMFLKLLNDSIYKLFAVYDFFSDLDFASVRHKKDELTQNKK